MSDTYQEAARVVMERCELLATFSEEPGRVTRRFASPPMRQVHETVKGWLLAAGMTVEVDAMGNLIGRRASAQADAKTLLLGSHLDTVRDAGKYDGVLGVMVALTCLERLHKRGERLPFALELLCFADEEGLRYPSLYMGSRAMTGTFQARDLELHDAEGISMAEALRTSGGNPDPALLTRARWASKDLLGYCEVHIEQGPVLEARDLPLAIVASIVGQQRMIFHFDGVQGHAGTLPMNLRQDALCAAAEFVVAAETLARSVPGLVATVGQMRVQPGASNVVPGHVELSLDVRHEDNDLLTRSVDQLNQEAEQICARRRITIARQHVQSSSTIACSPALRQRWQEALIAAGYPVFSLPSGAGHDGVALSELTEIAMLFVRCRGGISHNPAESVREADVAAAIAALERFLLLTAHEMADGERSGMA
ncbi:MAG TPA: allantoate amidohydrolase [Ktedonobacteraceae bacterium]